VSRNWPIWERFCESLILYLPSPRVEAFEPLLQPVLVALVGEMSSDLPARGRPPPPGSAPWSSGEVDGVARPGVDQHGLSGDVQDNHGVERAVLRSVRRSVHCPLRSAITLRSRSCVIGWGLSRFDLHAIALARTRQPDRQHPLACVVPQEHDRVVGHRVDHQPLIVISICMVVPCPCSGRLTPSPRYAGACPRCGEDPRPIRPPDRLLATARSTRTWMNRPIQSGGLEVDDDVAAGPAASSSARLRLTESASTRPLSRSPPVQRQLNVFLCVLQHHDPAGLSGSGTSSATVRRDVWVAESIEGEHARIVDRRTSESEFLEVLADSPGKPTIISVDSAIDGMALGGRQRGRG